MANRTALIRRQTKETNINLELDLDGTGEWKITTGIKMFDHLLAQLARHGIFDLKISATGDDQHHLVEDVAICLGRALGEALGEKRGITRMADAAVPMDDVLVTVIVDISGRGYTVLDLPFDKNDMAGFPTDLIRHFLESFAIEGKLNAKQFGIQEARPKGIAKVLNFVERHPILTGSAVSGGGMLSNISPTAATTAGIGLGLYGLAQPGGRQLAGEVLEQGARGAAFEAGKMVPELIEEQQQ